MSKLAVLGGAPVGALNLIKWPVFDESEEKAVVEVVRSGHWGI